MNAGRKGCVRILIIDNCIIGFRWIYTVAGMDLEIENVVIEGAVQRNFVYIIPDVFQHCGHMMRKNMTTQHLLLHRVHVNKQK